MKDNLSKGYVIVPREVLCGLFENRSQASGYDEAYLCVLLNVNYKPKTCLWNGTPLKCGRGEAIYTYVQWAELLGWTRKRTVCFFRWLVQKNRIRWVESPCPTHLHLNGYEDGTLAQEVIVLAETRKNGEAPADLFPEFWQEYHEITEKPKVNIGRARREWAKLSAEEKRLAIKNIEEYYDHLANVKYCKQAATYLADKSFKDEYDD
ncbi:MAG: hypothetical protein LUE99_08175 [Bacteroides sp.]|nr:hypothetical protein [Bacteroides sp.]